VSSQRRRRPCIGPLRAWGPCSTCGASVEGLHAPDGAKAVFCAACCPVCAPLPSEAEVINQAIAETEGGVSV
jgi:hypothetical protein